MVDEIVYVATDWWGFGATLLAGILTAIATMAAVIYTNSRTKKQLREQEIKFENERKEEYKRSKFVVIKPTLMLTTFTGLLDKLIVQNEYDRVLLFSGEDGFEFYDDKQKQCSQICRLLRNCREIICIFLESMLIYVMNEFSDSGGHFHGT